MSETKDSLRYEIARAVGLSLGMSSTTFRKDDLNQILDAVGGDALDASQVYAHDGPTKADLYQRVGDAVGFGYEFEGDSPRPFRRDELEQVRSAVE
mgnify:CR=1 FL=1